MLMKNSNDTIGNRTRYIYIGTILREHTTSGVLPEDGVVCTETCRSIFM